MPRYTSAYSDFVQRLDEVKTVLRGATDASQQPATSKNIAFVNALCRSGVVLLSSHIEGYVKDVGEIAIERIALRELPKSRLSGSFRYHLSHDLISEIKDTKDPSQIAHKIDELFRRDNHIWGSGQRFSGSLAANLFLANFATPSHDRIKKFFNRFGYESYAKDLARRLTANYQPCRNMVDQVVNQRNAIAHGDITTIGTPTDLAQMIALVKQYCRETDHVVGNWFSAQRCTIR